MTFARAASIPLVCLLAAVAVAQEKQPPTKPIDQLQGTWRMVASESRGKKAPEKVVKATTLRVKGNDWIVSAGNKEQVYTFTLAQSKKGRVIRFTHKKGDEVQTFAGLWKLEGDTLTVMRGMRGVKKLPRGFNADEGGLLSVWKRVGATSARPGTPPPRFVVVGEVVPEKNLLRLFTWEVKMEVVQRIVEVEVGGKKEKQPQTFMVENARESDLRLPLDQTIATSTGGQRIAGAAAWRAARGRVMLLPYRNEPIDPAFAAALGRDMLVISIGRMQK